MIDPVGVDTRTDIVCPKCGEIEHLDEATVERIDGQWDAFSLMVDNETLYEAIEMLRDADGIATAEIIDDGLSGPPIELN